MRPKEIQKILVDVAMTAVLLCLMAYLLLGEALHEWLGVARLFCSASKTTALKRFRQA